MDIDGELAHLGGRLGADVDRFVAEGKRDLEQHAQADPQPLFTLLRDVRPVLLIHDTAIVTRYDDVVEVLTNDEAFDVAQYTAKMRALAGDFILGLDDCAEYERDASILRLAAPRSDVPRLAAFVSDTAEQLVGESLARDGTVDVADLTKRVPARLIGRWFGTPGPDDDSMIAWTLPMFQDIFINLANDATIHADAMRAAAQLRAYLDGVIAQRRATPAQAQAQTDVLGRLLGMQGDPATACSDEDIATNLIGLVVGFVPTITTATTFAIDALLDRPVALNGAMQAVAAGDDDTLRSYMWEAMRLAPQAPGLIRHASADFKVAAGTMHEATIRAGTLTFAATQSAMLDPEVVSDPHEFIAGRPADNYLHFGAGLHECFGRFANAMQIPLIVKPLLSRPGLVRVAGDAGKLVKRGPFPQSLKVTTGR